MFSKFKSIVFIFTISVILSNYPIVNAESEVKVQIDGNEVNFLSKPKNVDGRILVPLRVIFEKMNAEVNWDSET